MISTQEASICPFIDFFCSTFLARSLSEIENFVSFLAKSVNTRSYKYRFPTFRGKRYEHCWGEPDDLFLVHGTPFEKSTKTFFDCRFEVKGRYLRHFSPYSEQLDFLKDLANRLENFSPTRIDCSFDDFNRRFTFSEVKFLAEQALFFPAESFHYHESGIIDGYKFGESISFGSRHSDKRLIFYDSDYVHQIPADRWEACYRREFAQRATELLISEEYNPAQLLLGGFLLFKDERGLIHPLWQEMREEAGRVLEIKVSIPPTSFYGKLAHVRDKYAANFAVFQNGLGEQFPEFMEKLLKYGQDKQSRKHRACVAKYRLQSQGKPFDLESFFALETDFEDDNVEFEE